MSVVIIGGIITRKKLDARPLVLVDSDGDDDIICLDDVPADASEFNQKENKNPSSRGEEPTVRKRNTKKNRNEKARKAAKDKPCGSSSAPSTMGVTVTQMIHPSYELVNPAPDVRELFVRFTDEFFYGALGMCTVEWSKRMTTCAGICSFSPNSGLCSIRLSEPLLKLRPLKDLIETLLHEMIHAYLFVTRCVQDRDGHGVDFQEHMHRINRCTGTNITIYHSFHAEVAVYKQHWWRCNGSCRDRPPFYGWVKRAMNRAPGKYDLWWNDHKAKCSGEFIKVKEPEKSSEGSRKKLKAQKAESSLTPKIDTLFSSGSDGSGEGAKPLAKTGKVTGLNDIGGTTAKFDGVFLNSGISTTSNSGETKPLKKSGKVKGLKAIDRTTQKIDTFFPSYGTSSQAAAVKRTSPSEVNGALKKNKVGMNSEDLRTPKIETFFTGRAHTVGGKVDREAFLQRLMEK